MKFFRLKNVFALTIVVLSTAQIFSAQDVWGVSRIEANGDLVAVYFT